MIIGNICIIIALCKGIKGISEKHISTRIRKYKEYVYINLFEGEEIIMTRFSERLAQFRKRKNLSLKEFEKIAGISAYRLSKFERGISSPQMDVLETLARNLNVSITWLIGEELEAEENE